jgi:hypothetical protein
MMQEALNKEKMGTYHLVRIQLFPTILLLPDQVKFPLK